MINSGREWDWMDEPIKNKKDMGGSKIVKNYVKEKRLIKEWLEQSEEENKFKGWMLEIKGGEFPEWYNSLDEEQKKMYAKLLEELKGEFRKPK